MFTLWYLVLGYKEYKYARNGTRSDKGLDRLSKSPRKDSLKNESFGVKETERIQPITPDTDTKSVPIEPPGGVTPQVPTARVKAKAPEPPKFTPQMPPTEGKPKAGEPNRFTPQMPPTEGKPKAAEPNRFTPQMPPTEGKPKAAEPNRFTPQMPPAEGKPKAAEPNRFTPQMPSAEPQAKTPEPPRFTSKPESAEPLKLVIPDLPPTPSKPPQVGILSTPKNSGTPKTPESPSSKFPIGKAKSEARKMPERKGSIPKEDEMLGRQGNRGPGTIGGNPKSGAEPSPRELSYSLHEVSRPVARGSSEEKTNISNPDSLDTSEDESEK